MKFFAVLSVAAALVGSTQALLKLNPDSKLASTPEVTTDTRRAVRRDGPMRSAKFARAINDRLTRRDDVSPPQGNCHHLLRRGFITIKSGDNEIGYIRNTANEFGEFGQTNVFEEALLIEFTANTAACNDHSPLDITTTNGIDAFPVLAAITGYSSTSDDLSAGSYNYAYLGGSILKSTDTKVDDAANSFTASTALPKASESSIWSFDMTHHDLDAKWINSDSSTPKVYFGLIQDVLIVTGDKDLFVENFGPTEFVDLVFSPW